MSASKSLRERCMTPWRPVTLAGIAAILVGGIWFWLTPSRADLERTAIEAIANHDLPRAESAMLRIWDRDNNVLRLLADVTYAQGRKRECLEWLEKLAEASAQPMNLYCEAGVKAFEFARPLDAERLYRRAIKASPATLEPYQRLARLYVAWQRGDELRRVIAEADGENVQLADDPILLWFWVVGDRVDWNDNDSRRWLDSVAAESPDDPYSAAAAIRDPLEPRDSNTNPQAVLATRTALPLAWPLVLAQANVELGADRIEGSLEILKKLPAEGERHAETWFLRGRIAESLGDAASALSAYEYACQLDPLFVAPLYHHGHLIAKMGKAAESETMLRRALQLDEFVRKCVRLLQSNQLSADDLLAVAVLGAELGQERWAQLVCQVAQRTDQGARLPDVLASISKKALPPLSLPKPGTLPRLNVQRNLSADRTPVAARGAPRPTESPLDATRTVISFTDTTRELDLDFRYEYGHTRERWLMETPGGGVAVLDYDRDGWPDLFFAQGGSLSRQSGDRVEFGQLRRNLRGVTLSDVTAVANAFVPGYSHGCAVGDVDNDGFEDLLVCRYGGLSLLMNHGDGTWGESAIVAGPLEGMSESSNEQQNATKTSTSNSTELNGKNWNTSAAFVDVDLDGTLDIYIAGYCHAPMSSGLRTCRDDGHFTPCRPSTYPAEPDTLLMNLGTGDFENRSKACGIRDENGYGLGVIAADFDRDGLPEIFVGNDTTQNFLWHRANSSGQQPVLEFLDIGLVSGVAVDGSGRAEACMGIACGDIDGDERLDLFVTNFFDETCTFYQNLGNLQFEDRTQQVGLSNAGRQLMGWGCQFIDADNDGWLDLATLNGHLHDMPQLPQFYRNQGGRFAERSSSVGEYFQQPKIGRTIATWDYNRDGRMDLVVTHQAEPAGVLRNDSAAGRHLTLTLVGTKSARDATGAVVTAKVRNRRIMRLVSSQGGYLSACMSDVNIGLGGHDTVDELEIDWPSGLQHRFRNLPAGQHLIVREGSNELIPLSQIARLFGR